MDTRGHYTGKKVKQDLEDLNGASLMHIGNYSLISHNFLTTDAATSGHSCLFYWYSSLCKCKFLKLSRTQELFNSNNFLLLHMRFSPT